MSGAMGGQWEERWEGDGRAMGGRWEGDGAQWIGLFWPGSRSRIDSLARYLCRGGKGKLRARYKLNFATHPGSGLCIRITYQD